MYGVGAASRTEFFDRKLVGLRLLVLAGRVVARLASFTRKRNQVSHYNTPRNNFLFSEPVLKSGKPTTGFEPVTSSLPRKCSTD